MAAFPSVSVVIPTHNRRDSLQRALQSLAAQSYPAERLEVIVVDDGSTDNTGELAWSSYPFRVQYHLQEAAGATLARNAGARLSTAEVLVFMDDDIEAEPAVLEHLAPYVADHERHVALATLAPNLEEASTVFSGHFLSGAVFPERAARDAPAAHNGRQPNDAWSEVHFIHCMTGLLAIKRVDFMALGMFQDPTGGWPNWDDVDFGYRAHLQGFELWRSRQAVAIHHDRSVETLEACGQRQQRAARSALALFKRHPDLATYIPDYVDKAPIAVGQDSIPLVARKLLRRAVSGPVGLFVLRRLIGRLEQSRPESALLPPLYRWTLSAYMFRGYRQGLSERTQPSA